MTGGGLKDVNGEEEATSGTSGLIKCLVESVRGKAMSRNPRLLIDPGPRGRSRLRSGYSPVLKGAKLAWTWMHGARPGANRLM
jgi:hypothetical protein